ncbi:hypothetical protein MAR_036398 [Mya arenaria]|uniref:Uncharacterized protein n=1 Tax=Mya arenaria TaxID=6604 RepID=A0ABY7FPD2_MYAAR|nr:hypothetical protein MAR_036398 [Mya arenaria]
MTLTDRRRVGVPGASPHIQTGHNNSSLLADRRRVGVPGASPHTQTGHNNSSLLVDRRRVGVPGASPHIHTGHNNSSLLADRRRVGVPGASPHIQTGHNNSSLLAYRRRVGLPGASPHIQTGHNNSSLLADRRRLGVPGASPHIQTGHNNSSLLADRRRVGVPGASPHIQTACSVGAYKSEDEQQEILEDLRDVLKDHLVLKSEVDYSDADELRDGRTLVNASGEAIQEPESDEDLLYYDQEDDEDDLEKDLITRLLPYVGQDKRGSLTEVIAETFEGLKAELKNLPGNYEQFRFFKLKSIFRRLYIQKRKLEAEAQKERPEAGTQGLLESVLKFRRNVLYIMRKSVNGFCKRNVLGSCGNSCGCDFLKCVPSRSRPGRKYCRIKF